MIIKGLELLKEIDDKFKELRELNKNSLETSITIILYLILNHTYPNQVSVVQTLNTICGSPIIEILNQDNLKTSVDLFRIAVNAKELLLSATYKSNVKPH